MITRRHYLWTAAGILFVGLLANGHAMPQSSEQTPSWLPGVQESLERELTAKLGEAVRQPLKRGLRQTATFWREEDGGQQDYEAFVRTFFAADAAARDTLLSRFEGLLEKYDGHMLEISREFRTQADLDLGPLQPYDELFAAYDPSAHALDDFFANKLAFVVLLNFPLTTLQERLTQGPSWTRRQWAEARLAQRFGRRVPAQVNLEIARAGSEADQYIAEYNIWMHHVLDEKGRRLFPPKLRLLSHWNLRDEIKANYAEGEEGLAKQRVLQKVMERIVTQTIPAVAVNNPHVDWNPFTNTVAPAGSQDATGPSPAGKTVVPDREPDTRYAVLLRTFRAARLADPYSPAAPTLIARRFDEDREIPEARVKEMLESVTGSPLLEKVAALVRTRIGRPLEPFDIWYNGFRARGQYTEEKLDGLVRQRYPDAASFMNDIPAILSGLGFERKRAEEITRFIAVDPARGSGHAWGSAMRSAPARLRTRVGADGMDYKGFNIAVHELGHNVEQVISLHDVDYTLLQGVPNTAFTEAMAFVFQAQDLKLLGLTPGDRQAEALKVLHDYWATCEISAVALVDMAVWHWMYDHPEATPAELREASLAIAKDVWNRTYATVFGKRDVELLAVYSHMIHSFLYLPDYPIGHLIAFQIEEKVKGAGNIGPEIERMARIGRVAPDLWMQQAAGGPVGAEAMLEAAERAVEAAGGGQ